MLDFLNSTFAGIIFLNKGFFVLFLLVPFYVGFRLRDQKKGVKFKFLKNVRKFFPNSSFRFYFSLGIEILMLISFILILANPAKTRTETEETKNGIDIEIALDISKSMLAEDISPNRIEGAKDVIKEFINAQTQNGNRIGFVIFAGKPFTFTPLTFDKEAINQGVGIISTDSINQEIPGLSGTAMGDAILLAIDNFKKGETNEKDIKRDKVIILVTDGDANMGTNPKTAIKLATNENIKIYTVGIGSKEGIELFITDANGNRTFFPDPNGNPLVVKLNEDLLKQIAKETNGAFYNAKDKNTLKEIFKKLEELNKTEIKVKDVSYNIPTYGPFILILLLLFLAYITFNLPQKIID
ncbi:MAG: VWA domain-containing protein [Candidatus Gracilibacteria bacterium]|nr:VWA domain-containing protein [Candidatus Gracilibacteria bacterium]MDD4530879.1 VWA domain-containing protein [Candidatus Gracilibacteria bacterium]